MAVDGSLLTLDFLEQAVGAHRPVRIPGRRRVARAGIAVVLREGGAGPEVLLVRRAVRAGDPWSGDMACPGGLVEEEDADVLSAAGRELFEETGLAPGRDAKAFGRLSEVPTRTHGRVRPMVVTPYCFRLLRRPDWSLNTEVTNRVWVPLSFFLDPRNRKVMVWDMGVEWRVPCYKYQGNTVWGLTLIVLDELTALLQGQHPGTRAWIGRLLHSL